MQYMVYYKKGLTTKERELVNEKGWTPELLGKTAGVFRKDLDALKVFNEYAAVAAGEAESLDEVFGLMNRSSTQPSQSLLRQLEVSHTSMSVGDVICDRKKLIMYQCSEEGWELVPL